MTGKNWKAVTDYARSIVDGEKIACREDIQKCERFFRDLEDPRWKFRPRDADFVIGMIEKTFVHEKGQDLAGNPMRGRPFLLEPFQKFDIYNMLGFYKVGTRERRFKEVYIERPRKNVKTTYSAALAWGLGLLESQSGSTIYITSAAMQQSLQSWNFIKYNIHAMGEADNFRIIDNNNEHSIYGDIGAGSIYIRALAANPDRQDSLNSNIAIADELHAYRSPKQYNIIKESQKAYTNKLMIGITTAGDNMASFAYRRRKYCQKVLAGTIKDEAYYISISKADEDEDGNVDFLSPRIHEMANPMYGITIRPDDIMNDARQAFNDPQQRKDFLAKSLNVYTSAARAYFNIGTFQASDAAAGEELGIDPNWTTDEKIHHLAKKGLTWYGGTDLSKLHDLTAAALVAKDPKTGVYAVITHAWFPRASAHEKAEQDGIPLFGWLDDGWLTMTNKPVVNYAQVVNWYRRMEKAGLDIRIVAHDRRFAKEYILMMERAGFRVSDQKQYDWVKAEGFRMIDNAVRSKKLYYLSSDAYEYCVSNVRGVEQLNEKFHYQKAEENARIDLFDASVFGFCQLNDDKEKQAKRWRF